MIPGEVEAPELPRRSRTRTLVLALLGLGLVFVGFEPPVIHEITYPNCSTNQPTPKFSSQTKSPIEHLFELAISRLDLRDGVLLVNDRHIPFDFTAGDLTAAMDYSILGNRYDGSVHIGKLDTKLPN